MKKAFSLVELAIVITILGLFFFSVVAGQKLVTSSKLRSVIADLMEYETAASSFELTFSNLPGDFASISRFFASSTDGDGDGYIEYSTGATTEETANAWNHINEAELIMGSYSAGDYPASKIPNSYYYFIYLTSIYSTSDNSLTLQDSSLAGVLSPIEAFEIDEKMDNGIENTGRVFIANGDGETASSSTCIDSSNALNVTTVDAKICRLIYWLN